MKFNLKKIAFITSLIFLASKASLGQDAAFTQYPASMLYLNPALAGEERYLELSANFRTQWQSVTVPYQTSQLSAIIPLYTGKVNKTHFGGTGISFYRDRAGEGDLSTTGINLSLSKLMTLTTDNKNVLAFGLQFGVIQRKVDYDKLQWGQQYQPFQGFNSNIAPTELTNDLEPQHSFLDIASGLIYYHNDIQQFSSGEFSGHFGISAYHLNRPNESFSTIQTSNLPAIIKIHGGIDIPITPFFYLSPGILTLHQEGQHQLNGNLRCIYNIHNNSPNVFLDHFILTGGIGGRLQDGMIISAGFGNRVFHLGYSYDLNLSGLNALGNSVGASELSLIIKNPVDHIFKTVETPRY